MHVVDLWNSYILNNKMHNLDEQLWWIAKYAWLYTIYFDSYDVVNSLYCFRNVFVIGLVAT